MNCVTALFNRVVPGTKLAPNAPARFSRTKCHVFADSDVTPGAPSTVHSVLFALVNEIVLYVGPPNCTMNALTLVAGLAPYAHSCNVSSPPAPPGPTPAPPARSR